VEENELVIPESLRNLIKEPLVNCDKCQTFIRKLKSKTCGFGHYFCKFENQCFYIFIFIYIFVLIRKCIKEQFLAALEKRLADIHCCFENCQNVCF
jgi:hypothetical protein